MAYREPHYLLKVTVEICLILALEIAIGVIPVAARECGTVGCYDYIQSKNKHRVYPNLMALPVTIVSCITGGGIQLESFCSFPRGFRNTPHDSDVIVVTDSDGNRDCVDRGVVYEGAHYNGVGCGHLVAYYPLDGNANDYSGYENHGTVYGAVPMPEGGYVFDGIDDYIDIGNSPLIQLTDQFSVAAWVVLDTTIDRYHGIVGKCAFLGTNGGMWGWMLYKGSGHGGYRHRFTVADGEIPWKPYFTNSENPFPNYEWVHTVGVLDGGEVRLYVNGDLESTVPYTGTGIQDSGQQCSIGRQYSKHHGVDSGQWGSYGYAWGIIDEVMIWSYVLSDDEVVRLTENPPFEVGE
jgi:hypothetical protein